MAKATNSEKKRFKRQQVQKQKRKQKAHKHKVEVAETTDAEGSMTNLRREMQTATGAASGGGMKLAWLLWAALGLAVVSLAIAMLQ